MFDNHKTLAYSACTAPHCAVRFGSLWETAYSRCVKAIGFFIALRCPVMGGLGGEPKGSLVFPQSSNPLSSAHPFGSVVVGLNQLTGNDNMTTPKHAPTRTTTATAFFNINAAGEKLFSINANIDLLDALEQASVFLSVALDDAINASVTADNKLHSVSFLIELSKSIVDSAAQTLINERSAA